jgi:phage tail-like protein
MGPFVFTLEQIVEEGATAAPPEAAPLQPTRAVKIAPGPEAAPEAAPPQAAAPQPGALPPTQAIPLAKAGLPPETARDVEAALDEPQPAKAEAPVAEPPAAPPRPARKPSAPPVGKEPPGFIEPPPPRVLVTPPDGRPPLEHPYGIPRDASSWLQYLPAVYSDDPFLGRFLLIFEALYARDEWIIDNFDLYLDPKLAPAEWLQWFGQWVDILVPSSLPEERQRAIVKELGALFFARGTSAGLAQHLELAFGVKPEIQEPADKPSTFVVKLKLGKQEDTENNREIATRIIEAQRPAHTLYTLIIE